MANLTSTYKINEIKTVILDLCESMREKCEIDNIQVSFPGLATAIKESLDHLMDCAQEDIERCEDDMKKYSPIDRLRAYVELRDDFDGTEHSSSRSFVEKQITKLQASLQDVFKLFQPVEKSSK